MKTLTVSRNLRGLVVFCAACLALSTVSVLSRAQSSTSVNIVNNSNRVISHVYISRVGSDDWSGNQLSDGVAINAGESFTLNGVACDQQQVRVIGEDQDGCFLSTVVNCGDSSTWTVTNDTARDCGN
jgi:hypothetical protein